MVAFNFKARHVPKIKDGSKLHTIRQSSRGARPGGNLELYTGQRTKQCALIARAVCKMVIPVCIYWANHSKRVVLLNEKKLTRAEVGQLALADGFTFPNEFLTFFEEQYGLPFYGELIEWFPLEKTN